MQAVCCISYHISVSSQNTLIYSEVSYLDISVVERCAIPFCLTDQERTNGL